MKRILALVLALAMCVTMFAGCGGGGAEKKDLAAVQSIIKEAQGMTMEELAKKAIAESKGKTFYGCSNYPQCDFVSWNANDTVVSSESAIPSIVATARSVASPPAIANESSEIDEPERIAMAILGPPPETETSFENIVLSSVVAKP